MATYFRSVACLWAAVGLLGGCLDDGHELGLESAEILDGHRRDPLTFNVGLDGNGSCSVTMVTSDVGFTESRCGANLKEVELAGKRRSVRVVRTLVTNGGGVRTPEMGIAAVQLGKGFGLRGKLRMDPVPLAAGETVHCFGYTNGVLRSGLFEVTDMQGPKLYLAGRLSLNFVPYEVTSQSVGGYCMRDGSIEIAAILIGETNGGVAPAVRVDHLQPALEDMKYASQAAAQGVAIRLLDREQERFVSLPVTSAAAQVVATRSPSTTEAFYLDEVSNPPAGGFDWYRLVDAATGQCLTATGGTQAVVARSCDTRDVAQMFYSDWLEVDGRGYYRFHGQGGVLDANGAGSMLSINPSSGADSQLWSMWLTRY